jgi:hypothetical protein
VPYPSQATTIFPVHIQWLRETLRHGMNTNAGRLQTGPAAFPPQPPQATRSNPFSVTVKNMANVTSRRDCVVAAGSFDSELPFACASLSYRITSRSSVTNRLAALTDIGGVNSIRSFTRSWQRAAAFAEVIPQRPAFVFAPDQAPLATGSSEDIQYTRNDIESAPHGPRTSLLRQHLEADTLPRSPIRDDGNPGASSDAPQPGLQDRERKALDAELPGSPYPPPSPSHRPSIFSIPPHLATPPLVGSYTSFRSYGSIQSDVSRASMRQAGALWRQQQEAGANIPDGEIQPILVKEVEQDGKIVLTVEGQSTLPQTIFNSIKCVSVFLLL